MFLKEDSYAHTNRAKSNIVKYYYNLKTCQIILYNNSFKTF